MGLGVRRASGPARGAWGCHTAEVAAPAFLGGVVSSAELVARMLGLGSVDVPGVAEVASGFLNSLDGEAAADPAVRWLVDHLVAGDMSGSTRAASSTRPQALLQAAADASRWRALESGEGRRDHLDRLQAVRRPRAGGVWCCFPSQALGLTLSDCEFVVAARCWLGILAVQVRDGCCGARALLRQGAFQIARHDAIRDVLYEAARVGGCHPWRERAVDASQARPADVYLPNWSLGRGLAADVTVSHPSQATLATQARRVDSASSRAAQTAASHKVSKHGDRCRQHGVDFLPLAVCAYGGWLPEGEQFVGQLAQRVAERAGLPVGVACSQLWQRLSVTLWRSNAQTILHAQRVPGLGSWDLPGFVRP